MLKQDSQGKDKDPIFLKNWRPLTLLCCDSRILAKCLSLRVKRVISDIIHVDQSGFIHGRFIADNIRRLIEIIEKYEREDLPGLVFIADFEKAFDKVRWDLIFKSLDFLQFRPFLHFMGESNV